MARKGGGSTQRLAPPLVTNGHANANPPPSTIAAQIVHNASNINRRQDPGTKITFAELIKEFLRDTERTEPDSELIALVSVIDKEGLDALFKDDPFAINRLREQGVDSLAALTQIFQQRPHLLLSAKEGAVDDSPRPPLFILVFSKLLGLLKQESLRSTHQNVQDVLVTCLTSISRPLSLWRQAGALLQLYKSCIDDVLSALESTNNASNSTTSFFNVVLPSSSSITEFWPDSQHFVALSPGLQTTITSRKLAIYISFCILHSILRSTYSLGERAVFSSFEHQFSWILDSCTTLWRYFKQWTFGLERGALHDKVEALYMHILETTSFPSAEGKNLSAKAALFVSDGLTDLLQTCSISPFCVQNQLQLASLLIRLRRSLGGLNESSYTLDHRRETYKSIIVDDFEAGIAQICQDASKFTELHMDLQVALCLWTSQGTWPDEVVNLRESLYADDAQNFADSQLYEESRSVVKAFRELNVVEEGRPSKRRKTVPVTREDGCQAIYNQLLMALNESPHDSPVLNLSNLHNIVQARYSRLSNGFNVPEQEQSELISVFGKIACAGSNCIDASQSDGMHWRELGCTLCDASHTVQRAKKNSWDNSNSGEDWKDAIAAMLNITREEKFQRSSKPRVLMALAIGRIFNHISDPDYLSLEVCELGQWLLASMSRSLRELKIAASRALMVFLREDIPKPIREKNRRSTIEFFHALAKRDVLSDQETLIMAYGQAARVCGESELPIILNQLVEYLGHTNPLICGMAYNELVSIADVFHTSPMELLRPYWRVVGFSVVKDILNKPQKAQQLSDLTEQGVDQLLNLVHSDTLPHLVLMKRRDILERIARARRTSIEDICTQPRRNLARILALLLCQPVADIEKHAMDTLAAVAPKFREHGQGLDHLVQIDSVLIAVEVLKLAADQDESKKQPYHRGFHTLAVLSEMRNGQRRTASKKKNVSNFFELHILGIIATFSDTLDNPLVPHPLPERRRAVGAIGEMINLAGNYVAFALPQLRACLQSAMSDAQLCDQTFFVWSALLTVLDEEDLALVIDQTFALIVENWSRLSDETQLKANDTLQSLVKHHNTLLQERLEYLPSLASIPMMSKLEGELARLKAKVEKINFFNVFSKRCKDENPIVVRQALKELVPFLEANQRLLHQSAISQKPLPALTTLSRSLLDACVRFAENYPDIPVLCAQCLGVVGGLDPYKVETVREKKQILVLSNFNKRDEVIDFCTFLLERILVKVFLSTTNTKAQGYVAYVMQELLRACSYNQIGLQGFRSSQSSPEARRWTEIPEAIRNTLTPFLTSRYVLTLHVNPNYESPAYPIFSTEVSHSSWLRTFVFDLLHKAKETNTRMIFPVLSKVIKSHDLSIPTFILPFAVLNVIITGDEQEMMNVGRELLTVLETEIQAADPSDMAALKQCSENVFQTLDYLALWLQEKRREVSDARVMAGKTGRGISEVDEIASIQQISCVERMLQLIPAEVISKRAVECGSYARALFHWEQYYRQKQSKAEATDGFFEKDELLQHLQFIYDQIDEPDSIEGISALLPVLNPEQQIMEHRKAGRWTAAQSWYELSLAEKPTDTETQINLLTCLKESGQYDSILNYVDSFHASNSFSASTLHFATEAAWSTGKWAQLERILSCSLEQQCLSSDFNVGLGKALLALRRKDRSEFKNTIESLREALTKELTPSSTTSLHACHDALVKLHALYEIEAISGLNNQMTPDREAILENLDRRLDILGAYTSDKQYLLGVRRAAMQLSRIEFTNFDIASGWLTTARLARKGEFTSTAYNSVLHATQLGDDASKIEYSKLLWKEGHHRKAIQNLQGAIASNAFQARESIPLEVSVNTTMNQGQSPNRVKCHAQLLLAKWLDRAGQTKTMELKEAYAAAIMSYPRWDKGHYYLGRYYLKLFESEKKLPVAKQTNSFIAGELTKLTIENYIRSTVYGTKHYYQTIPKVLTLWLDLGMEVMNAAPRMARDKELYDHKVNHLDHINKYIKRYSSERMPAFAWYTAFPQIITRISHPHKTVWDVLQTIILKVAGQYPQQALWSLLAVLHSAQDDRRARGTMVLQKLRSVSVDRAGEAYQSVNKRKESAKRKSNPQDLKNLIVHGQRLTDALLAACDAPIEQRVSHVSLSRDLGFNHKLAPCALVVPIEATMIPTLPATNDSKTIRAHNPFPQDSITISSFTDDVLVLSSLQRPRKVNVRGSDGRSYSLLCKPKDDLRKDQRLMEFNAMINRALTRDIESSKRRLYIKTYGVTPLNEECGTIEWVEGLKPMRDILIRLYRQKNIQIDYAEIRTLLNEACSDPSKTPIFTHKILGKFQPVLYEWFVETFPEPEAWFAARLRYTRSCAVMSIAGHVLGLGDRHGENVNLEEGNGGIFHVDFNCLFDKGLTFEKPELVPFRLTHNMVDAMGPSGVEGPFRKAAELTYAQLRQHEDTLITVLETFVHDPTADFLGGGKRKKKIAGVPDTPQEVLDFVRTKLAGLMRGESVPLSVEGYVDSLLQMARDPRNLAAMYIGWCAFF